MAWFVAIILVSFLLIALSIWLFRYGTYQIDKILINKDKQIWWFLIIIVSVFVLIAIIGHLLSNGTDDSDFIFHLYGLFSQTVGVYPVSHNIGIQIFYVVVSLVGTVLFSGTLIATITNSFQRRIEDSQNGYTRYSRLRGHDIVLGANEILISAILFLARENRQKQFVIVTNHDIERVRKCLSELQSDILNRIIIYKSDITASEFLRQLCIERCRRVVILGDGEVSSCDAENVVTLKRLHRYVRHSNGNRQFHCYVSYFDDNMLLNYCCNDDYADTNFRIYPFNFYAQWADKIWGYGQLYNSLSRTVGNTASNSGFIPLKPLTDKAEYSLHIVIVGFSAMAMELMKTAVKVAHFANFDEQTQTGKTLITAIADESEATNRFRLKHRMLTEISDVDCEFVDCDINSKSCWNRLSQYAASEHGKLHIVICSDNSNDNIMIANNLPADIYKYSIPTLVYQKKFTDAVDCLFDKHLRALESIKIFGAYNSYVDLCGSLREAISLKYIYTQTKAIKAGAPVQFPEEAAVSAWFMAHWDNVRRRWMATVNAMYNMVASANFQFAVSDRPVNIDNYQQFIEAFAPILQRQYIAWNILSGYTPGDMTKRSEWTLKKVNTLHTLSAIQQHSDQNDDLKSHIESIHDECISILNWLSCNKIALQYVDNE